MPFATLIGAELVSAAPDQVRGRLHWAPERCTTGGVLHGGVLMALEDQLLPPGARGVRGSPSTPRHVGRTTIVVQTDLRDGQGRHVARITQTQAVILPA